MASIAKHGTVISPTMSHCFLPVHSKQKGKSLDPREVRTLKGTDGEREFYYLDEWENVENQQEERQFMICRFSSHP